MPTSYKVLGQSQGTASTSTYTTLYTVPSNTETIISCISVCNTSVADKQYRVALCQTTTPSLSEWIAYDTVAAANDTTFMTVALTMDSTVKYIIISSEDNTLTFGAFGSELS